MRFHQGQASIAEEAKGFKPCGLNATPCDCSKCPAAVPGSLANKKAKAPTQTKVAGAPPSLPTPDSEPTPGPSDDDSSVPVPMATAKLNVP